MTITATPISTALSAILDTVDRPGGFCASGKLALLAPRLEVEGVGPIALPLLEVQAKQLIAAAEPAPYGRGEDTLVDPTVRRTWQVAADRVHISGKSWTQTLERIVAEAANGLGVTQPVTATLYKLLIYDEGCFFVRHRDTEKVQGMFATLVIALPSLFNGGDLVVRHKGQEISLDMRCDDPAEAAYAAFYADCLHELLPVTKGYRLSLIYNLTRRGNLPVPPDHSRAVDRLTQMLTAWSDDGPKKLVYPLEHAYTPAEVSFNALKGADAARGTVLRQAAKQADCEISLAFFSVEESGIAEHEYYGRWGRGDDNFQVIEVDERTISLSDWHSDELKILGTLPVEEEEISPPEILRDLDFDDEVFHEATGNEGASFERTWRRTSLVLWPRNRRLAVLNQGGLDVTLPLLASMAERPATARGLAHTAPPDAEEASELARQMMLTWPTRRLGPRGNDSQSPSSRMLEALSHIGDASLVARFISEILATSRLHVSDIEAVLKALGTLQAAHATAALTRLIEGNAAEVPAVCATLLAGAKGCDRLAAAEALVTKIPEKRKFNSWDGSPDIESSFVVDLLTALCTLEGPLAERAAATMLERPACFALDEILVPALCCLRKSTTVWRHKATQAVLARCLDHLQTRAALPLTPPGSWKRDARLSCKCTDCSELARFLGDGLVRTWTLKAAVHRRRHVEDTIKTSGSDLDMTTSRKGNPHSLICTKNQASYERRALERRSDLKNLAILR